MQDARFRQFPIDRSADRLPAALPHSPGTSGRHREPPRLSPEMTSSGSALARYREGKREMKPDDCPAGPHSRPCETPGPGTKVVRRSTERSQRCELRISCCKDHTESPPGPCDFQQSFSRGVRCRLCRSFAACMNLDLQFVEEHNLVLQPGFTHRCLSLRAEGLQDDSLRSEVVFGAKLKLSLIECGAGDYSG